MALLKAIYENKDDIPAEYVSLYAERDGKWEVSEIEGIKTQGDVDRLSESLRKERELHGTTKQKLHPYTQLSLSPDEIHEKLDSIPALEAAAQGKGGDEEVIKKRVEGEINKVKAPLERKINELMETNKTLSEENTGFKQKDLTRTIHDKVRGAAKQAKINPSAEPDILMLAERVFEVGDDGGVTTKDQVGVTPGVGPDVWLSEMQKTRPHWWPGSSGSGAGGSVGGGGYSGKNPFTREDFNLREQNRLLKEQPELAKSLMAKAGVERPGVMPPAKTSK